jgi:hypothetical protein
MCKITDNITKSTDILSKLFNDGFLENEQLKKEKTMKTDLVDSSQDFIFVSEIITNKIIFMNHHAKKEFGNVTGQNNFNVFLNFYDTPCINEINKTQKWIFNNVKMQKIFLVLSILRKFDDKTIRTDRAIDLTENIEEIKNILIKIK